MIECGVIDSTFIDTGYIPNTVLDTRGTRMKTFCLGLVRKTHKQIITMQCDRIAKCDENIDGKVDSGRIKEMGGGT